MKRVNVAVGVILRAGKVFVCKRHEAQHQGGLWEFPGGKKEQHESIEQALSRELAEEIGIDVQQQRPLMVIEHDYGDKFVCLDVRIVDRFNGEPVGKEGQLSQWVAIEQLVQLDFPAANSAIVERLVELGC